MPALDDRRLQARIATVEKHVAAENRRDLDAIMATFGETARYEDEPWSDRRDGRDAVRAYYGEVLRALPDLTIDIVRRHAGTDSVVLEVVIRGTHLGPWRGLPASGRPIAFALCGVFEFDDGDRLVGERIYYDRSDVLRQLGFFHDPATVLGRLGMALSHPVSIARAYLRPARRVRAGGG
jgi:steroid delta-isomerase-like uncharacterized protein